jgi:transcriptional regulator with XRE-family HTH domain
MDITQTIEQRADRLRTRAEQAEQSTDEFAGRQRLVQVLGIRWTRAGLAGRLGVSESLVNKWYYGQRAVSDDAWVRLQALSICHSAGDDDNKPPKVAE